MSTPKKSKKPAKKSKAKKPRQDDEDNFALISLKMFELINKNPRIPTNKKLAEATGLCEKTIERHRAKPRFKEMLGRARSMNDMMMVQYMQKVAKSSDAAMWRDWWKLTEPEFAEVLDKRKVDVTSDGKAIQIKVIRE